MYCGLIDIWLFFILEGFGVFPYFNLLQWNCQSKRAIVIVRACVTLRDSQTGIRGWSPGPGCSLPVLPPSYPAPLFYLLPSHLLRSGWSTCYRRAESSFASSSQPNGWYSPASSLPQPPVWIRYGHYYWNSMWCSYCRCFLTWINCVESMNKAHVNAAVLQFYEQIVQGSRFKCVYKSFMVW